MYFICRVYRQNQAHGPFFLSFRLPAQERQNTECTPNVANFDSATMSSQKSQGAIFRYQIERQFFSTGCSRSKEYYHLKIERSTFSNPDAICTFSTQFSDSLGFDLGKLILFFLFTNHVSFTKSIQTVPKVSQVFFANKRFFPNTPVSPATDQCHGFFNNQYFIGVFILRCYSQIIWDLNLICLNGAQLTLKKLDYT